MVKIIQGTPQAEVKLVVDLAGELPMFNCHEGYDSSLIEPIICTSPIYSQADKPVGTCAEPDSETCSINVRNPATRSIGQGELISDIVTVTSNPDSQATPVPSSRSFAFCCAANSNILTGLATSSKGVAGLGRSSALSLPSQFADGFRFPNIFSVDLHDSVKDEKVVETTGKIYFGGGPYIHYFWGISDLADRVLTYTPLLINPKSKDEYFVDVKSIQVHGETVPMDENLLSIEETTGIGTSIYKAFIKAHTEWVDRLNIAIAELMDFPNITMVAPVSPFTTCYDSSTIILRGPSVVNNVAPSVSFVFPTSVWNISFFDLVIAEEGVAYVAFVDGGLNPVTSLVIGARQIGFLEFDISRSRLGFEKPNLKECVGC
ncbi:hypothetical protein MKW98_013501 [Papaver atlanticum]|uniref:Peptidase A1 domain-containing protein n=1 Tax=Papaver atlanticum TaxID=357466 RepID=A0AAD4SUF5_9MAGN|nr:hypothetical protein MKW98_013501 [Papaver atlanticum]